MSTIPDDYLFWYPPCPKKTFTITGESRVNTLRKLKECLQQSKLGQACELAVELHCSGFFPLVIDLLIELIGTHVHIHNPNVATRLFRRYQRFAKQLGYPAKSGVMEFPMDKDKAKFFERKEITQLQATINCQGVRNFVAECMALVALSHQKAMTLPRIKPAEINTEHLCKQAKKLRVGGTSPERIAKKNELTLVLMMIQKCLFYKTPKIEDAIYWTLWILKLENKCKRSGEKLPCQRVQVNGIAKGDSNHWVWHVWRSLFARLTRTPHFKQTQIRDLYELFKLGFLRSRVVSRLPTIWETISRQ
jgi:hypothetical protein